jgi:fucose permease
VGKKIVLFVLLFATMFMLGLVENMRGVSFPLIKDEFDVPFKQQGFLVSMLSLAYVLANILAGILLGRFDIKPAVFAGYSAICLGLVLIPFMPGFFSLSFALFAVFGGFGFLDIGMNALASRVFVTKAALLMNLLHSFYGIGSMLGPRIAGFAENHTGLGWRFAYLLSLPLVLLLFAVAAVSRFPKSSIDDTDAGDHAANISGNGAGRRTFLDAVKTPMVWLLSVTLGLALIIDANTPNWGPLYFQDVYGLDPAKEGASFLSMFFLLFTVSRLVCGPILEKIGYIRSLLGVSVLTFAVFAAGFLLGAAGIHVLPVLGFLIALFWPTLLAVAIVSFGKDAPVYAGAMISLGGLINTAGQFLVGFTNSVIGPAWGYRSSLLHTALLIFVLLLLYKSMKRNGIRKV